MSLTRPTHYTRHGVEPIDAIDDWGLGFALGNTVKYVARAGRKIGQSTSDDLRKALWYLAYEIGGKDAADRAVSALEAVVTLEKAAFVTETFLQERPGPVEDRPAPLVAPNAPSEPDPAPQTPAAAPSEAPTPPQVREVREAEPVARVTFRPDFDPANITIGAPVVPAAQPAPAPRDRDAKRQTCDDCGAPCVGRYCRACNGARRSDNLTLANTARTANKGRLGLPEGYISGAEAARRLRVTETTIRTWLAEGRLGEQYVRSATCRGVLESRVEQLRREIEAGEVRVRPNQHTRPAQPKAEQAEPEAATPVAASRCADCGKEKTGAGLRCRSCHGKHAMSQRKDRLQPTPEPEPTPEADMARPPSTLTEEASQASDEASGAPGPETAPTQAPAAPAESAPVPPAEPAPEPVEAATEEPQPTKEAPAPAPAASLPPPRRCISCGKGFRGEGDACHFCRRWVTPSDPGQDEDGERMPESLRPPLTGVVPSELRAAIAQGIQTPGMRQAGRFVVVEHPVNGTLTVRVDAPESRPGLDVELRGSEWWALHGDRAPELVGRVQTEPAGGIAISSTLSTGVTARSGRAGKAAKTP